MAGPNNKIFSWVRATLATTKGKQLKRLRSIYPETIFAMLKSFMGSLSPSLRADGRLKFSYL